MTTWRAIGVSIGLLLAMLECTRGLPHDVLLAIFRLLCLMKDSLALGTKQGR